MRIAIAFFLTFAILPIAAGLVYALLYSLGIVGAMNHGFTLDHWGKIWTDRSWWASLGLSALVAVTVTLLSAGLALRLLGWLRPLLELRRVRFVLHWPLALPPIIAAFFSFQWLGNSGILARLAYHLGWSDGPADFPSLINDAYYLGVGFTLLLTTFPFFLLLFLYHYQAAQLPQLSQLSATLGASAAQIRLQVMMPILLRRAAPTLLLYFVFLLGAYEVPLLLGRQSPAMLSVFISQKFSKFNLDDLPLAYAATVLYMCILLVIVALFFKERWPHLSAQRQARAKR